MRVAPHYRIFSFFTHIIRYFHARLAGFVGQGSQREKPERQHARPHVALQVLFVVHDAVRPEFDRCFLDLHRDEHRFFHLAFVGLPGIGPASGHDVLHKFFSSQPAFVFVFHQARFTKSHHRTVIHGMVEYRARQHQPVDQCHRYADGNSLRHLHKKMTAYRAVQIQRVFRPAVSSRYNKRLIFKGKRHMANQSFVEDGIAAGGVGVVAFGVIAAALRAGRFCFHNAI